MGEIKQKDALGFNGVGGEIRNGDFSVLQLEKEMRISTWITFLQQCSTLDILVNNSETV